MPLILPRDEYNMLRDLARRLGNMGTELNELMAIAQGSDGGVVYPLCGQRPSGDGMACDRYKDHPGKHVWELGDEIARLNIGAQPKSRIETLNSPQADGLRRWLASPSGSYVVTPGLRLESVAGGGLMVRVQ